MAESEVGGLIKAYRLLSGEIVFSDHEDDDEAADEDAPTSEADSGEAESDSAEE